MVMVSPIGSRKPNSSLARPGPIVVTRATDASSLAEMKRPRAMARRRIPWNAGVTPRTCPVNDCGA